MTEDLCLMILLDLEALSRMTPPESPLKDCLSSPWPPAAWERKDSRTKGCFLLVFTDKVPRLLRAASERLAKMSVEKTTFFRIRSLFFVLAVASLLIGVSTFRSSAWWPHDERRCPSEA